MLKGRMAGVAALVSILAALWLAPSAIAAEPPNRTKPNFDGAISLRGTNGYRVSGIVVSVANISEVMLFVGRRGEEATYTARGVGTENSVDIDLGRLGRIDVEVRPTGTEETLHEGCGGKGKAITVPAYELVGTIDFHGEEGFTEVETTHAPLLFEPLLRLVCPGSAEGTVSGAHVRGVQVVATAAGGPTLKIEQNHLGAPVFYEATMHEDEGAVRVSRTVEGHLGAGVLRYDPLLATASFSAASPFSGAARYAERTPPHETRPGRGAWLGSLKIDFPGHANVPLAGPAFQASIIHARRTESHQVAR